MPFSVQELGTGLGLANAEVPSALRLSKVENGKLVPSALKFSKVENGKFNLGHER